MAAETIGLRPELVLEERTNQVGIRPTEARSAVRAYRREPGRKNRGPRHLPKALVVFGRPSQWRGGAYRTPYDCNSIARDESGATSLATRPLSASSQPSTAPQPGGRPGFPGHLHIVRSPPQDVAPRVADPAQRKCLPMLHSAVLRPANFHNLTRNPSIDGSRGAPSSSRAAAKPRRSETVQTQLLGAEVPAAVQVLKSRKPRSTPFFTL